MITYYDSDYDLLLCKCIYRLLFQLFCIYIYLDLHLHFSSSLYIPPHSLCSSGLFCALLLSSAISCTLLRPSWPFCALLHSSVLLYPLSHSAVLFHAHLPSSVLFCAVFYFSALFCTPPLARVDFEIKVKWIAHSIVHFDQWNKQISKM